MPRSRNTAALHRSAVGKIIQPGAVSDAYLAPLTASPSALTSWAGSGHGMLPDG